LILFFSQSGFAIAGVPSRSKIYRTSAACEIHSALHFAQKSRVYVVYFEEKNYIFLPEALFSIEFNIKYKNP
jgi:hypothetical protein